MVCFVLDALRVRPNREISAQYGDFRIWADLRSPKIRLFTNRTKRPQIVRFSDQLR